VKTTVTEDRLLVISDIHMGNPLHQPRRPFMDFLHFAIDNDYSICINGDGVDLLQMSLPQLTGDLAACLGLFRRFGHTNRQVYYTVGNHDIALEHFLADVGQMAVVPFLNVHSGGKRFRIEHGHMYDPMFLKFPRMYSLFTFIGRLAIGVSPEFYHWIHKVNLNIISFTEFVLSGFKTKAARNKGNEGEVIEGERDAFRHGAEDVGVRGFDAVMFGHTHIPGAIVLNTGNRYFNTGGWFTTATCVAIDNGRLWYGLVSELVAHSDPFPRTGVTEAKPPLALAETVV
jgi:UDP-2,3-diacylglucosamine pyrophosphatase LpxH